MLKKSLLLMAVISLNILSGFASEDQKEEKKSFFPQNFTAQQLEQLYTQGEAKDGFKIYKVEGENKETLYSYAPSTLQIITKTMNPLQGRVNFEQESYETIEGQEFEIVPGMKEEGILKKFIGIYKLQGAYEKAPTAKINVTGNYDLFRLIFSNENFNENGLCLYRLFELNENFIKQTPKESLHRFNVSLSRLFYLKEALKDSEKFPLIYSKTAEELGRKWFVEHMKENEISDAECIAVLTEKQTVSLSEDFYTLTVNGLKKDIYSSLGIDTDLLQSMYEGIGKIMIDYQYALTADPTV